MVRKPLVTRDHVRVDNPFFARHWNRSFQARLSGRQPKGSGSEQYRHRKSSMRIAEVAPLAESVPPKLYGGTERVVSWLTDGLLDLNCSVTLFASGDSKTRAHLVPVCPQALRLSKPAIDPAVATSALFDAVAARAGEFDLIHWHTDWLHLPLTRYIKTPSLTTLHGRLDLPFMKPMVQRFGNSPFVSISNSQRGPLPELNWAATIYHGLPERLLSYRAEPAARTDSCHFGGLCYADTKHFLENRSSAFHSPHQQIEPRGRPARALWYF